MQQPYKEFIDVVENYTPSKRKNLALIYLLGITKILALAMIGGILIIAFNLIALSPLLVSALAYRDFGWPLYLAIVVCFGLCTMLYCFGVYVYCYFIPMIFQGEEDAFIDEESGADYNEIDKKHYLRIKFLCERFPQVNKRLCDLAQTQNNEIYGIDYRLMGIHDFYNQVRYDESVTKLKTVLEKKPS